MADAPGVELLRKHWEIEDHWMLRRDFMIAHKDRLPPERLLCLAQIFVNTETLGAEYADEVMDEIRELGKDVPTLTEFRQKKLQLQTEGRFKAPPKAVSNDNSPGTRNVTHDRYQSHQQNYSQGRQDYSQYQQMHGHGKAQSQFQPRPAYGQGYNPQPQPQQRYGSSHPAQHQQAQYQPVYQPAYGRNAVNPNGYPQGQAGGGYGQRNAQQDRQTGGRGGGTGSGSSYQNLLNRNQRR